MYNIKNNLCLLLILAMVTVSLHQANTVSIGFIKLKDINKVLSKTTQNEVIKEDGAQFEKPAKFTEGIYIKKYWDDNACFKFETPEGIKIISDPYNMNEIVNPDIVTESHQHSDHNDVSMLRGNYKLIKTAGSFEEKGIKIEGLPGKHDKGDDEGTNFIYVFDIDGIRIAHFASQGEIPSNEVLDKIKNVDILLIQVFTDSIYDDVKLDLAECKTIVNRLNPKIIIPEHGTPYAGASIARSLNIKQISLIKGEMVVTKKELNDIKGTIVVELDNHEKREDN